MKRVMFVIGSFHYGGVGKVLYDLVRLINSEEYEITIYSIYNKGAYKNLIPENIKFKYILDTENKFKEKLFNFMIYRFPNKFFYKLFIKDKYDVEIAFMENYPTKIVACSPNKKSKKIAWVHTDLIKNMYSDSIYNSIDDHKKAYERFDDIICVSKASQASFEKKFNIKGNVHTIYNPIKYEEIIKKSNELGFNDKYSGIRILTVGRLSKEKGQDMIISVASSLKNKNYDFKWYLIGDGNIKEDLQNEILEKKLNNNVILLGEKENPYPYIKQCDIYVQASRYEGYCMALKEAIIFKKPIVTTNFSGAIEQLENGKTGLIVDVNEEKILEAVCELIKNRELRKNIVYNLETRKFNIDDDMKKIKFVIDN